MTDTRTPPAALEGGLPPCLRLAVFEGHYAGLHRPECPHANFPGRFDIYINRAQSWGSAHHGNTPNGLAHLRLWSQQTDDPEEAERLWAEACERLREVGR